MDLLEKSRNTLELPAVLEMLAGEAVSEPGAEGVLGERPGGRLRLGGGTLPAIRHRGGSVLVRAGGEHSEWSFDEVRESSR